METAKIMFLDGTELNTDHNGNCFIVDSEPQFPEDLSEVNITITSEQEVPQPPEYDEEGNEFEKEPVHETVTTTETLHNVTVQECYSNDGKYWFTFLETSEETTKAMELEAQTYYTAMMTDTLLEV